MRRSTLRTIGLSIAAFAVTLGLALWIGSALRSDGPDVAESDDEALSIDDAIGRPAGEKIAVRGYVFFDEQAGDVLCSSRTGDPPECGGNTFRLEGIDPTRLELEFARDTSRWDAWSTDAVVLLGTRRGGTLVVEDIL